MTNNDKKYKSPLICYYKYCVVKLLSESVKMWKCALFLLFSAAILHQGKASGKDDAKKAFHQLMAAIDKALTQAQKVLNKAVAQFQAKSAELEAKAKAELDKSLAPLRTKLDDLVAKAKAKGFDVAKCKKYLDDFSYTPDQLVHNLLDCFNQQLTQAQSYVNNALDNAKKMERDLNSLDGDIDKCAEKKKWKQAECYAKLTEKIVEDTKSAPQHIIEDAQKTANLVMNLVPNLEACFLQQVKNAEKGATKDVTDFALCAAVPTIIITQ